MKLSEIFTNGYNTDKHDLGYIDNLYDEFFYEYRNKPITMLEIGVQSGGSIHLWRDYLTEATIYAGDIIPFPEIPNTISVIGDLYSPETYNKFADGMFDIIVDDGPHTLASFESVIKNYYNKLKKGGYLIVEDIVYSSWVQPLVDVVDESGYSECVVLDMTGLQKTDHLLNLWRFGLFVLKIKK